METGTSITTDAQTPVLHASGLTHVYPGMSEPAIDDLSIIIHRGEIFGLLGPNGAGKTTAISAMASVLKPSQGKIMICETDVYTHPRLARSLFGFVPQDIALYPSLTITENLWYFGTMFGLPSKLLDTAIHKALETVGLAHCPNQRIDTCSGGMKRRANLAAGILHDPKILFLDEPTVGIDAQSRNLILEQLSILKQQGMSMLYTTHYMEEAEAICSRIAIMDKGRIIAQGPPTELIHAHPGCDHLGDVFLRLTGKQLRD